MSVEGLSGREIAADQIRVAENDGQDVVEVVRDSTGESQACPSRRASRSAETGAASVAGPCKNQQFQPK